MPVPMPCSMARHRLRRPKYMSGLPLGLRQLCHGGSPGLVCKRSRWCGLFLWRRCSPSGSWRILCMSWGKVSACTHTSPPLAVGNDPLPPHTQTPPDKTSSMRTGTALTNTASSFALSLIILPGLRFGASRPSASRFIPRPHHLRRRRRFAVRSGRPDQGQAGQDADLSDDPAAVARGALKLVWDLQRCSALRLQNRQRPGRCPRVCSGECPQPIPTP